ncbi:MAG: hypothetical protein QOG27_1544 [Verrucomicrobiota bacterium]
MAALVFLLLGVLCGLIARALLITSAFGISKKWGFAVFVPFGPLFFRLSYPDEARRARLFQLATLPCIFLYVMTSNEMLPSTHVGFVRMGPPGQQYYALAAGSYSLKIPGFGTEKAAPNQPSVEERRAANDREFQRLHQVSEELRVRKRDLLNSDTEGARVYNQMANDYNAALDKYNAEKFALTLLSSPATVATGPKRP